MSPGAASSSWWHREDRRRSLCSRSWGVSCQKRRSPEQAKKNYQVHAINSRAFRGVASLRIFGQFGSGWSDLTRDIWKPPDLTRPDPTRPDPTRPDIPDPWYFKHLLPDPGSPRVFLKASCLHSIVPVSRVVTREKASFSTCWFQKIALMESFWTSGVDIEITPVRRKCTLIIRLLALLLLLLSLCGSLHCANSIVA